MSTAAYNGVIIIESLNNETTGEDLLHELKLTKLFAEFNQPKSTYFVEREIVENRQELFLLLEMIQTRAESTGFMPIIHFEMHGLLDSNKKKIGVILKNGESIYWKEFSLALRGINRAYGNNLIIGMAVCFGAHLIETISATSEAPMWGVIGSEETLYIDDIPNIFTRLYREMLTDRTNPKAIIDSINTDYRTSLKLITAENIFLGGIKRYYDFACNPTHPDTWKRISNLAYSLALRNPYSWDLSSAAFQVQNYITSEKNKEDIFNRYSYVFFMKDIPGNTERFSQFSYQWLCSKI